MNGMITIGMPSFKVNHLPKIKDNACLMQIFELGCLKKPVLSIWLSFLDQELFFS